MMQWHLQTTDIESVHSYHMGSDVRWDPAVLVRYLGGTGSEGIFFYRSQSDPYFFCSSCGALILLVTEDEQRNGIG